MRGFTFELFILVALFIALFFQKNWRNRGFLLAIVLGAMFLTHAILLAITYFMIQNKLHGLGYLRYPTQWLPVVLPILAWVYAHKKNVIN